MSLRLIFTIICVAGIAVCAVILSAVTKMHDNTPNFRKQQKEKEEAYKRRTMREQSAEEIFDSTEDLYDSSEYNDDDNDDDSAE